MFGGIQEEISAEAAVSIYAMEEEQELVVFVFFVKKNSSVGNKRQSISYEVGSSVIRKHLPPEKRIVMLHQDKKNNL
jgi:hypothetical protein